MCTSPKFRVTNLGTREVTFYPNNKELEVRQLPPNYYYQKIACGLCIQCRLQKAKENAWRAMQEAKLHKDNIMLTLTYDDKHVPHGKGVEENGEVFDSLTLRPKDLVDFKKRLRKMLGKDIKIKTAEAGEYGSNEEYKDAHGIVRKGTMRPHYHMLIFGYKPEDMKPYKVSKCEWSKELNQLYKSKTIEKLWPMGYVDLNEVNYETCCYVARYVTKKYKGTMSDEVYEKRGQVPEFYHTSKGFGKQYYENHKEEFYAQEKIWQKTKKGLIQVNPGRYFDKLMEKDNPEKFKEIKRARKERSREILAATLAQTSLNIDEYREQMDYLMNSKTKKLKRQL